MKMNWVLILSLAIGTLCLQKTKHKLSHTNTQTANQTEQYIVCKFRSGKAGYVTHLKPSLNKNEPVTIINKNSHLELDRLNVKVYVDSTKTT